VVLVAEISGGCGGGGWEGIVCQLVFFGGNNVSENKKYNI
jgi:hypothetical protein